MNLREALVAVLILAPLLIWLGMAIELSLHPLARLLTWLEHRQRTHGRAT